MLPGFRTLLGALLLGGALTACVKPAPTIETGPQLSSDQHKHRDRLCAEGAWEPGTPAHCECMNGYVRSSANSEPATCSVGETQLEVMRDGHQGVCCEAQRR